MKHSWSTVSVLAVSAVLSAALAIQPASAYPPGKKPIVATAPKTCIVKKPCKFVVKQVKAGTSVTMTFGKVKTTAKASKTGIVTLTFTPKTKIKNGSWSLTKLEGKVFKGLLTIK